ADGRNDSLILAPAGVPRWRTVCSAACWRWDSRSARPGAPARRPIPTGSSGWWCHFPPAGPSTQRRGSWGSGSGPFSGRPGTTRNPAGPAARPAARAVAAAEPDGYTLLFGNASALVVGPAVYRFRDYDTARHFTPVAKVTEGYEVLVVAPDFPAANVQELVAHAKARAGRLNFGSMGY